MEKLKKVAPYLKIVFGLSLLVLLLYKIPFKQTVQLLKDASIPLLLMAIFISSSRIVISSIKLQILTRLKNEKIKLWSVIRAYYIGYFFNNFMPTDIGGDVFKINELRKSALNLKDATTAVIVERLTRGLVLIILALFLALPSRGMFEKLEITWLRIPFLTTALILFVAFILAYIAWKRFVKRFLKKRENYLIWGKIYKIAEAFYVYRNNLKKVSQASIISLGIHLLGALTLLVLTASVGNTLPFINLLIAVPIVKFVSLLPVSIGALGIKEGALVFCLTKLGLTAPAGLTVALLLRFCTYTHSGIGGLLYIKGKKNSKCTG